MTSPINTFLDARVTELLALLDGADPAFNKVIKSPGFDLRRAIRNSAWPMAMVSDEGGRRHRHNKKIEDRSFSVTVAVKVETDGDGEDAEDQLLELCELVLQGDGTNPGLEFATDEDSILFSGDSEPRSQVAENGAMFVSKTLTFGYKLQRS